MRFSRTIHIDIHTRTLYCELHKYSSWIVCVLSAVIADPSCILLRLCGVDDGGDDDDDDVLIQVEQIGEYFRRQ